MQNTTKLLNVLLLSFGFCCAAVSAAEPLKAGVEASQILNSASPLLRRGPVFDEANLPPLHTTKCWYEIPDWFAGTWHRENEKVSVLGLPLKVKASRDRVRGTQLDALGHIWQACDEPSVVKVNGSLFTDYKLIFSLEPLAVSKERVTLRFIVKSISVDNESGKIIRVYDSVEIQESTLASTGHVRATVTNGKRKVGSFDEVLTAPFSPVDQDDHRNYDVEFCEYLRSEGKANLNVDKKGA
ncbi:MAG: hypothetical protein KGS72_25930 [Cyanobacteria bacterium REEB67]|nr:hypothetical protein [Cyanobacteria bacterium REEB67]